MNVADIKSSDWSLSGTEIGAAVEGVDDINQCIGIILSTQKGSDPFRPLFGSDIWEWVDRPLPIAVPNMKKAIREAIGLWERRVEVTYVNHEYQNEGGEVRTGVWAGLQFDIGWRLVGTQTTNSVIVTLGLYDAIIKAAQSLPPIPLYGFLTTEAKNPIITEASDNIIV